MVDRLLVSVWRIGYQAVVTLTEVEEDSTVTYRITYPVTYAEACDFGHWATNRVKVQGCNFFLCGDGWDIYVPIGGVISDNFPFRPIHHNTRTDPKCTEQYAKLINEHHSVTPPSHY